YDALSYTWGNLAKTHEMKIGDASLPITTNLYMALRELRRKHTLTLWVDAVCIDQSNCQERNHQVRMMRRIFSNASSVIVWLG
ncbi:heterokaryon incompatibility, partial [Immersiella caudata]